MSFKENENPACPHKIASANSPTKNLLEFSLHNILRPKEKNFSYEARKTYIPYIWISHLSTSFAITFTYISISFQTIAHTEINLPIQRTTPIMLMKNLWKETQFNLTYFFLLIRTTTSINSIFFPLFNIFHRLFSFLQNCEAFFFLFPFVLHLMSYLMSFENIVCTFLMEKVDIASGECPENVFFWKLFISAIKETGTFDSIILKNETNHFFMVSNGK